MSRPLHRLLLAGTSALGITALTLGLTTPAVAAPTPSQNDPESITAALDELKNTPFFGMLPGAAVDQLTRTPAPQARGARAATAANSVTPTVEEVDRTENSATFRFTLPAGEVTRDGAVLQAYWDGGGFRYSELGYLTNPVGYDGVDRFWDYDGQVIGAQIANLLRENFSITGATAVTGGANDYLVIPAGHNSFEITVTSARTAAELGVEFAQLTGDEDSAKANAAYVHETRLALPQTDVWAYGERFDLIADPVTTAQVPNGADELRATVTPSQSSPTLSIVRHDEQQFSGDRVLRITNATAFGGGSLDLGTDGALDVLLEWTPPPLRPVDMTTVVTGASAVGNDFYKPNPGVREVVVTTTHDGPRSVEEAESAFITWATETCGAEMTDPIPGVSVPEDSAPITWQSYLQLIHDTDGEAYDTQPPIYTGPEYVDAALTAVADRAAAFRYMAARLSENENSMFAGVIDWDAACGTSEGPGDGGPGDGDDEEPGDAGKPATVTLQVPDAAEAGKLITLSATVLDDDGDPVVGQQVTFTIEEGAPAVGTLRAAARTLDRAGDGQKTLTGTTDANGVATVTYTPGTSGTLRVTATTGGANPVSTGTPVSIPVTAAPGDGGGNTDDDDDDTGGGNQSGSGALGALLGSLGSTGS